MKKYGLIGYPIKHSFSKEYFTKKFEEQGLTDHEYNLYPLPNINEFQELVNSEPELCGLNVTIPHKIGVMFYLDKIDEVAKEVDAVNCIKIVTQKPMDSFFSGDFSFMKVRMEGFNTDAYGFEESLKPLLKKQHRKALVLGNGGAARAVFYVLKKLDIDYVVVSRKPTKKQFGYADINADVLKKYPLIINTTPLGMSPDLGQCPDIPYNELTDKHLLYDLVYNPDETEFLKRGKAKGAVVKNGLEMLHLQAEKAWDIWNDKK